MSCSAGNFGLAELGVWALSKTYLECFAIGGLISRSSFPAPALNRVTPPGVLPIYRATRIAMGRRSDDHVGSPPGRTH